LGGSDDTSYLPATHAAKHPIQVSYYIWITLVMGLVVLCTFCVFWSILLNPIMMLSVEVPVYAWLVHRWGVCAM